jgi:serine/threonine protein kinase
MGITDQFRKWRRHSQAKETWTSNTQSISMKPEDTIPTKKVRKSTSTPKKQYPPSPDAFLQGIGDYTFIKQVGQGKFSRVILSYHYITKKQVAIKVTYIYIYTSIYQHTI